MNVIEARNAKVAELISFIRERSVKHDDLRERIISYKFFITIHMG